MTEATTAWTVIEAAVVCGLVVGAYVVGWFMGRDAGLAWAHKELEKVIERFDLRSRQTLRRAVREQRESSENRGA